MVGRGGRCCGRWAFRKGALGFGGRAPEGAGAGQVREDRALPVVRAEEAAVEARADNEKERKTLWGAWSNPCTRRRSEKAVYPGLGITFGLTLVKHFLRRSGLRANAQFLVRNPFQTGEEISCTPSTVKKYAEAAGRLFQERGFKPDRLAIDGVPGSGKSTLARALAEELGMDAVCLDHQNMDEPRNFDQKNTIYEHHRLFRTQDLDVFDALIYLDEPVAISQKKVLERQRGGYLVDLMDYDLLKKIGEQAFAYAAGEELAIPDSFIKVKIKPAGGFRDREKIDAALHQKRP